MKPMRCPAFAERAAITSDQQPLAVVITILRRCADFGIVGPKFECVFFPVVGGKVFPSRAKGKLLKLSEPQSAYPLNGDGNEK